MRYTTTFILLYFLTNIGCFAQDKNGRITYEEFEQSNLKRDSLNKVFINQNKSAVKPILKLIKKKNYGEAMEEFYKLSIKYGSHPYLNNLYDEIVNKIVEEKASQQFLQTANMHFDKNEYEKAITNYFKYLNLNYNNKYCVRRIKKSRKRILRNLSKEQRQAIYLHHYSIVIKMADDKFNLKEYRKAIEFYKLANKMRHGQEYPKRQIEKSKLLQHERK
jgi:hypothetical protein